MKKVLSIIALCLCVQYSFALEFSFDRFVTLLKNVNAETAKGCGFSFIYADEDQPEDDPGTSVTVYGWGVEKGEKQDFGYELKCFSDNACYFYYQLDTSTQAAICFKDKDDADRFIEKALAYGIVIMNDGYYIADEELPNGTVKVDSFSDYSILTQMMKPEYDEDFHKGFYVIRFYYFA